MKAWQVPELGEPRDVLTLAEVPDPEPGPGQVLVRVLGAAANFPDVLMCRGGYQVRPPLPFTPGVELCGEVVAAGPDVTGVAPGDRLIGGPGRRRLRRADADERGQRAARPGRPGRRRGGAPSSSRTRPGGSGCTGAPGWRRARPCSCTPPRAASAAARSSWARRPAPGSSAWPAASEKAEVARALGADVVIDRNTQDFVEVVKEVTGGRGADVIYDPVGGDTYARSTKCIAFEGRILVIGFAGGQIQSAALNHALVKNYSIVGLHWGLYQSKIPQLIRDCHAQLTKMVADGAIRPLVSERLGLDEVPAGLQRLADGGTVGRVVFVP